MQKAVCGVIGGASAQAVPTPVRSLPHPFSPFGPPRRAPSTPMSKKSSRRPPSKPMITQTVIHPDAAGIDLASEVHYVAGPAERDPQPVRNFGSTTDETRQSRPHPPTQGALPAQASGPTRFHPPTSRGRRRCLSEVRPRAPGFTQNDPSLLMNTLQALFLRNNPSGRTVDTGHGGYKFVAQ